jgi:uncharacterized protein (TIGR02678 family)
MKELEILLENYWISKDENKELYYRIKDSIPSFKTFLAEKLGYQVIVNPNLIKLEKTPGKAEAWMGINDFDSNMEYAFLCNLLMFLEDKGSEEQFVLSQITEFIQGNYTGDEKVDWTLYKHRKSLIKVLRFAVRLMMIKLDDGNDQSFANTVDTEVLYESTGLSRYFVRNFTTNMLDYNSYKDIEAEEWGEADIDRGIIRRQRVYRRIIMSPIVYNEGSEDADYDYIKKQRSMIENDLDSFLDFNFHVHKNGALVVLDKERNLKDTFPGGKAISDVVLLFNSLILEKIEEKKLNIKVDDTITVSTAHFESLVEELKERFSVGWSKEYREEKSLNALTEDIITYMKDFNMIKMVKLDKEVEILPLVGKVAGRYPEKFIEVAEAKEAI